MIKTVIADDDFLVRSYLKQLGAWEKAGFQIIADERDGESALETVYREHPAVVITDISMPLMDGIEFIRNIRQSNQEVYIIVLSCHDDFEYVKEAMRLGADEYVLKNSLSEESLYELLENTKRQMKNRKTKSEGDDRDRHLIELGQNSLKYYFFNGILAAKLTSEEREKRRAAAGIRGRYVNSAVVVMFIPEWQALKDKEPDVELEAYCQAFLQKLSLFLKNSAEDSACMECIYLGEGIFCNFVDMSELHRDSLMKQRLTAVATACFRCCREEEYRFGIGVSSVCFGREGLRQAYQQAREMLKIGFYKNSDILYYEENPRVSKKLPEEADCFVKNISIYREQKEYKKMEEAYLEVLEVMEEQYTDPKLALRWLGDFEQLLGVKRTASEYSHFISIEQLRGICGQYRRTFLLPSGNAIPQNLSPSIRAALDFVQNHYKESIGLSEAAREAGLNPAYFSYLFKQELGTGFAAYLLNLRMECAKTLLKNCNDKIKEVASQSGFGDYHYFSKTFKKMTGLSPADYRKKYYIH